MSSQKKKKNNEGCSVLPKSKKKNKMKRRHEYTKNCEFGFYKEIAKEILQSIANISGIRPTDIIEAGRNHNAAVARYYASYQIRRQTGMSSKATASFLGYSHSGIVATADRRIKRAIEGDKQYEECTPLERSIRDMHQAYKEFGFFRNFTADI
tara:strand:+ start:947 stop:1405 length:459 start_codon:yes stop_codon:yes gene_type:complete